MTRAKWELLGSCTLTIWVVFSHRDLILVITRRDDYNVVPFKTNRSVGCYRLRDLAISNQNDKDVDDDDNNTKIYDNRFLYLLQNSTLMPLISSQMWVSHREKFLDQSMPHFRIEALFTALASSKTGFSIWWSRSPSQYRNSNIAI